jgi:hypothetical protein
MVIHSFFSILTCFQSMLIANKYLFIYSTSSFTQIRSMHSWKLWRCKEESFCRKKTWRSFPGNLFFWCRPLLPRYHTSIYSARYLEEIATPYRGNGNLHGWLLWIKDCLDHCRQPKLPRYRREVRYSSVVRVTFLGTKIVVPVHPVLNKLVLVPVPVAALSNWYLQYK